MRRFVLAVWVALTGIAAQSVPADAAAKPAVPRVQTSEAGRAALAAGRDLVGALRGLRGPERKTALEQAAAAHDRIAEQFAAEVPVAAAAVFTAAELWRQQGSFALAEKDYLRAASLDAARFAQRGLFGAAEMQRRQQRPDEALGTYAKAEAVAPGTGRAQQVRLCRARLLLSLERVDEAVSGLQAALESAEGPSQVIEAANLLALAFVKKGDLDAAARAIEHAERAVEAAADDDDAPAHERHLKALEGMSARRALQRARDERDGAGADAVHLDAARRAADGVAPPR
ncbi:MAG: hypothetical protein JNL08_05630 [Planctomycetes bacterium]|nr:hypothetical protein [Planctomycetota bacterium]